MMGYIEDAIGAPVASVEAILLVAEKLTIGVAQKFVCAVVAPRLPSRVPFPLQDWHSSSPHTDAVWENLAVSQDE